MTNILSDSERRMAKRILSKPSVFGHPNGGRRLSTVYNALFPADQIWNHSAFNIGSIVDQRWTALRNIDREVRSRPACLGILDLAYKAVLLGYAATIVYVFYKLHTLGVF